MMPHSPLIDYARILAARDVIAGRVHRTPVVTSSYLGRQLGVRLHLKLELFQKTGSFKVRGVLNKLHNLSDGERQKGVISLSAGNHAQALAWGAAQWGVASTIVMPAGSVRSKVEATRGYGGEVVLTENNLLDTCLSIQQERGLTLIHPFDDLDIIAGQGTVGVEILEDVPDVDVVVVGVGGGGIISGIAAAVKETRPDARVVGVEPDGAPTMSRSLERGAPAQLANVDTIADGLAAPFAGEHTFAHVESLVDDMVTVSDDEIRRAMRLIIERCKVTPEPAAAAGLAALVSHEVRIPAGASVVCLLSGGNVDRDLLKSIL